MYKYYIMALLSMGSYYAVFSMAPAKQPYLSEILPPELQERIVNFVADAPNLEQAVKNIRGLLSSNKQFTQFTPGVINYLSDQPYMNRERVIKAAKEYNSNNISRAQDLYQGFKKILVALQLATPEAHNWIDQFAKQYPDIVGEYAFYRLHITPYINWDEAFKIENIVSNSLELKRYDSDEKVFTPEAMKIQNWQKKVL